MNIRIKNYQNKENSLYNYLKLLDKCGLGSMFDVSETILTNISFGSIDRGCERASEGRHTPGTGDGALVEGHGGSV